MYNSITMNRNNLNIPINSTMLPSTYESTQSIQRNGTNGSINSINRLNISTQSTQSTQLNTIFCWRFLNTIYFVDLFLRNRSISLTFFGYFGSTQLTQSNQSLKIYRPSHLFYENELTQSPFSSLGKKLNQLNRFSAKMSQFKSINSVELNRIQVCLLKNVFGKKQFFVFFIPGHKPLILAQT